MFNFTAMALCDMCTLLFPAPGLIYMYTLGNHYKPLTPITACYAWNALNEVCLHENLTKFIYFTYSNRAFF